MRLNWTYQAPDNSPKVISKVILTSPLHLGTTLAYLCSYTPIIEGKDAQTASQSSHPSCTARFPSHLTSIPPAAAWACFLSSCPEQRQGEGEKNRIPSLRTLCLPTYGREDEGRVSQGGWAQCAERGAGGLRWQLECGRNSSSWNCPSSFSFPANSCISG